MKVLNLYAGIGGNRKLWPKECKVTTVEINPEIARAYQNFNNKDKVIICDAHDFLLNHYKEFDFIWSSPPCPSHSHIRKELAVEARGQNESIYPDMKLYEEILFFQGYFKGKWIVENVISWYKPLIRPFEFRSHYYWSNFVIDGKKDSNRNHHSGMDDLALRKGFNLSKYKGIDKRKILRNCVEPEAGLHIFNCAFKIKQQTLEVQNVGN